MKIKHLEYPSITKAYLNGDSTIDIAKRYKVAPGCIWNILSKLKIPIRNQSGGAILAFQMGKRNRNPIRIPEEQWKLAYLAGLIDGEGTISIGNRNPRNSHKNAKPYPYIKASNTDVKMIEWIIQNFGGNLSKGERLGCKSYYTWGLYSVHNCLGLLKPLVLFLITKKESALQVIEYCEARLNG